MTDSPLKTFARSPLARHPRLLLRKVAKRIGLPLPAGRATPVTSWRHSSDFGGMLRTWARQQGHRAARHPETRLFGRDFDRSMLFDLCRNGVRAAADLTGDPKLVWEFSRAPALLLNALFATTEDRADESARGADFLRRWIDANPPRGLAWTNAMEVGLRAVAWICADDALDGGLRGAFGEAAWREQMALHRHVILSTIEANLVSSNHYLANLLGVYYIERHAGLPVAGATGREFEAALAAQGHDDGGAYEASLPYHALITEMALLYAAVAGSGMAAATRARIGRMVQIVADFSEPGCDVIAAGDDDSGRVIPLDACVMGRSRADVLLDLAHHVLGVSFARRREALCTESGWWISRAGDFAAFLEFGGVGFLGRGGHAHNDDLAVAAWYRGAPVLVDAGSYLYTPDPETRHAFRSTSSHNVLTADDREQHAVPRGAGPALFSLPGRVAALPHRATGTGQLSATATLDDGAWTRTVAVTETGVRISDDWATARAPRVVARFLFHPDWQVRAAGNAASLRRPDGRTLTFHAPAGVELRCEQGWYSPVYGTRVAATRVCAEFRSHGPHNIDWFLAHA